MLQRTVPAAACLALLLALAAVLHTTGQPLEPLQASLPESAAQTLAAARHLAAGHGPALDGLHPTNGLPLLPTALATGLVALVPDQATQLRALVALGGAMWLCAGYLLWRLLARWPLAGLAALAAWLAAGFDGHPALLATDAGLSAALLSGLLWTGHRFAAADPNTWQRRAGAFGGAAALLGLTRPEFLLLGALLALWVFARARAGTSLWRAGLRSLPFTLPMGLAATGWLAANRWAGGSWLPLDVLLTTSRSPWTLDLDASLAAAPGSLLVQAERALPSAFAVARTHLVPHLAEAPEAFWWSCLGAVLGLPLLPRLFAWLRCRPGTIAAAAPLYLCFALFVLAQLLAALWHGDAAAGVGVGVLLLVALTLGGLLGPARRWWQVVLALPLAATLLGSTALRVGTWFAAPEPAHAAVLELGHWLEALPPGQRIGTDQPGQLALAAPHQACVDLTGTANDAAFLRERLLRGTVAEYCREQNLAAFAAVLPLASWQERLSTLPQPVRPLQCTLAVDGRIGAVLALPGCELPPHPLAGIFWRALALGELPTLPAAGLAHLPAEERVVASLFDPVVGGLRLVAMPEAAAAQAIAAGEVTKAAAHPPFRMGPLTVLGTELAPVPAGAAPGALVRVYVQPAAPEAGAVDLVLQVDSEGSPSHRTWSEPLASGGWQKGLPEGAVVVHTFLVEHVGLTAGRHTLSLSCRAPGQEPTPPQRVGSWSVSK